VISERDVQQYRDTGYLVVPDVLDAELLARVSAALDRLVSDAAAVSEHTDVYDLEPGHTPQNPKVRRIKLPHTHTAVFWELANYPPMVAILEKLLGPSGVRLQSSKINLKAPHYGSPVEWHQDWAFYPHTNDDMLAVGVMLDDAFMENGPLLVDNWVEWRKRTRWGLWETPEGNPAIELELRITLPGDFEPVRQRALWAGINFRYVNDDTIGISLNEATTRRCAAPRPRPSTRRSTRWAAAGPIPPKPPLTLC